MTLTVCAWCDSFACSTQDETRRPAGCPQERGEWLNRARETYEDEENRRIARAAAHVETTGYCQWTRLEEIGRFAEKMDFKTLGLAFCSGLKREARVVADYFRNQGFEVISAVCSCGGIHKGDVGIPPESRFRPEGFEAMCNPIGQAMMMNEMGTQFNVVLGLCVGHDSLFFRYAEAPTTVLAAKDRVLGHNPLAAVYLSQSYYRKLHEGK